MPKERPKIIVIVEGGCVQAVQGMPKGFSLFVHDYDVEQVDCEDTEVDARGDHYQCLGPWTEEDNA